MRGRRGPAEAPPAGPEDPVIVHVGPQRPPGTGPRELFELEPERVEAPAPSSPVAEPVPVDEALALELLDVGERHLDQLVSIDFAAGESALGEYVAGQEVMLQEASKPALEAAGDDPGLRGQALIQMGMSHYVLSVRLSSSGGSSALATKARAQHLELALALLSSGVAEAERAGVWGDEVEAARDILARHE